MLYIISKQVARNQISEAVKIHPELFSDSFLYVHLSAGIKFPFISIYSDVLKIVVNLGCFFQYILLSFFDF